MTGNITANNGKLQICTNELEERILKIKCSFKNKTRKANKI